MTSESANSLTDEADPLGLGDLPTPEDEAWRAQLEQVRQRCVAEYSSSPLFQARAAKDPEYWNKFYVGQVR
jgi:hypothetical protein